MQKIDRNGCYYFYGNKWKTWEDLRKNFRWEVPARMNAAYYVCDTYVEDGHGDNIAIYNEDTAGKRTTYTYRQLQEATNRLANYLLKIGVKRGDRVAVCLSQRAEPLIAHIAVWRIGAVSMPLTVLFGTEGLKYRMKHSDAKVAIMEDSILETLEKIRPELPDLEHVLVVGENRINSQNKQFWAAIEESPATMLCEEMNFDDNMVLIYTGGTTGDPKGVVHKHANILRGPGHFSVLCNAELRDNDVFWNPADYAWAGPLFDLAFPALFYGKAVVTYSGGGKFDPEKAFKLIEDYKITIVYVPPTGLRMMRKVENPEKRYNLSSVRLVISGAEAFGKALPEWAAKTFGSHVVIHEGMGQTEATPLLVNCQRYFEYKYNIGKPVPGLEIDIIDEQGNRLPPGQTGELAVKAFDGNPVVLKEYWKNPQGTKEKFLNDWMLTGDLAIKDEEGYFTFVSRKDDIIISSGYRIGPSEIEDVLIKHPAVLEAGVIGIPDETRGEIPKAFIVLRDGFAESENLKKELQKHVQDKLAKHEYMRAVQFMKELPKTTTGKILRRELRKIEAGKG